MSITYEWDVETMQDDEVFDHRHATNCSELITEFGIYCIGGYGKHRLVLIREEGDQDVGITDRSWAYVTDEELPEHFENGKTVPSRFHKELRSAIDARAET